MRSCSSREIGRRPACPPQSKVRSGPAAAGRSIFCLLSHARYDHRRGPSGPPAYDATSAALLRRQHADGHWLFELEADPTIPAEYVLLEHFLDRIDAELGSKIGVYLRGIKAPMADGRCSMTGRSIFVSVKAYFALG